jgi:PAS domain-containing protein
MDTSTINMILNIAGILLGGGALVGFLTYRTKMRELSLTHRSGERTDDRTDFDLILKEIKSQRDEATEREDRCQARLAQMEVEIQGLRLARDLDPFPNWIVDQAGSYLYVNREFERYFLEPKGQTYRDVIGKRHEDVGFPKAFCDTLKALDAAARSRPDGTARAITALHIAELGESRVTVHKFPIRFKPAGVIVGYAGFITDLEPVDQRVG